MATRSGSVDPGLVLWVQRHGGLSADQVQEALEHESGLRGLSGRVRRPPRRDGRHGRGGPGRPDWPMRSTSTGSRPAWPPCARPWVGSTAWCSPVGRVRRHPGCGPTSVPGSASSGWPWTAPTTSMPGRRPDLPAREASGRARRPRPRGSRDRPSRPRAHRMKCGRADTGRARSPGGSGSGDRSRCPAGRPGACPRARGRGGGPQPAAPSGLGDSTRVAKPRTSTLQAVPPSASTWSTSKATSRSAAGRREESDPGPDRDLTVSNGEVDRDHHRSLVGRNLRADRSRPPCRKGQQALALGRGKHGRALLSIHMRPPCHRTGAGTRGFGHMDGG